MPIDLTTVPEDGGPSHGRRRRSHRRHRHQKQVGLAIAGGFAALAFFGLGIFLWNHYNFKPPQVVSNGKTNTTRMAPSTVDGDPLPVEQGGKNTAIVSAPAVSSGELPPNVARAKIIYVRRVIGADGGSNLEVKYEFLALARAPTEYLIAVRSPRQSARAAFNKDSPRDNVVRLTGTLNRIGSEGPIDVWIETIAPSNERVSNVMTIP